MAHLDDTKQSAVWPPHETLPHLAAHTPIQVSRQADLHHHQSGGAFHAPAAMSALHQQHHVHHSNGANDTKVGGVSSPWTGATAAAPFGVGTFPPTGAANTQPVAQFRPTWPVSIPSDWSSTPATGHIAAGNNNSPPKIGSIGQDWEKSWTQQSPQHTIAPSAQAPTTPAKQPYENENVNGEPQLQLARPRPQFATGPIVLREEEKKPVTIAAPQTQHDDSKPTESQVSRDVKHEPRISPEIDVTARDERESSAEEIDVECSAGEEEAMEGIQESGDEAHDNGGDAPNKTSTSEVQVQMAEETNEKHDEASRLLLNFSHQSFSTSSNSVNSHEPLTAKSSSDSSQSQSAEQPAKPVAIRTSSASESGNGVTNGQVSQNQVSTIVATGFVPSGQSAFQSPDAVAHLHLQHQQSVSSSGNSTPLPSTPNGLSFSGSLPSTPTHINGINGKHKGSKTSTPDKSDRSEQPSKTSYIRPPGLGPVSTPPAAPGQQAALVCPICGFSCPSKFHYNSHMNTHGDHQCTMCDYTSRTEGRLKKHMRESHSEEERQRAGIDLGKPVKKRGGGGGDDSSNGQKNGGNGDHIATNGPTTNGKNSMLQSVLQNPITTLASVLLNPPSLASDTSSLSTTMASLVDAANAAAAASIAGSDAISTLQLDISGAHNLLGQLTAPQGLPSALDQIRAFTENSALLPEGGMNLANALGVMTGVLGPDQMDTSSTGSSGSGGGSAGGGKSEKEGKKKSESRRSSSGKVKQFKCKQCPHLSFSRDDCWAHARTHIPPEKQLNCRHCNFVTEYKHHLEYHYRNHNGTKPFQCVKCAYTCVNKSMLNSHMKSHTNVYQFRCMDCTYATKYCHSLKLHLKKYGHRRVPDGIEVNDRSGDMRMVENKTPDSVRQFNGFGPLGLGDGPNPVTSLAQQLALPIVTSSNLTSYASQMLLQHHQMSERNPFMLNGLPSLLSQPPAPTPLLKCSTCDYEPKSQEDQLKHSMSHFFDRTQAAAAAVSNGAIANTPASNGTVANGAEPNGNPLANLYTGLSQISSLMPHISSLKGEIEQSVTVDTLMHEEERESGHAGDDEMEESSGATGSPACSSKGSADEEQRQKRKAFKLEQISQRLSQGRSPSSDETEDKDHEEHHMESSLSPAEPLSHSSGSVAIAPMPVVTSSGLIEVSTPLNIFQTTANLITALNGRREGRENMRFHCAHCKISFEDQALYHIHMGYHGYDHAFKCNRCGYSADNSLDFNVHLMQGSHD